MSVGGIGGAPFASGPAQSSSGAFPAAAQVPEASPGERKPLPVPLQPPALIVRNAGAVRSPTETVKAFYESFTANRLDEAEKIYAPNLKYSDPLFTHGDSKSTMHMWRTLLAADQLKMGFKIFSTEGDTVKGMWTADYVFHGRPVHEESQSTFVVKNGKIVSHHDEFSTVAWAKQALPLGPLARFADTTLGRAVITRLMRFGITLAEKQLDRKEGIR